jgi:hypothetical protein
MVEEKSKPMWRTAEEVAAAMRRKETIRKVLYALLATGFIVIAIMLYLYDVPMQN